MIHGTKALIALIIFALSTFAHASPKSPHPKNLRNVDHDKTEVVYCAPGMPCHDSRIQSQLDLLIQVAGFGAKAEDPRKTMKRIKGSEEGKSGTIYNETLRGKASVSLVGECYALTNAHAIVGAISPTNKNAPTLKGWPKDRSALEKVKLKLKFGQKNPKGFATEVSGKVVEIGDFHPQAPFADDDWALIHLDECIGKDSEYGHYAIAPITFEQARHIGNKAIMLSHPGDKDSEQGVQVQEECGNIIATDYAGFGTWGHNCNTSSGSSGGALTLRNKKTQRLHLFAMNAVGDSKWYDSEDYTGSTANGAISMISIYQKIKPYLEGQQLAYLSQRTQAN